MVKPQGVVLYRGPSQLDGAPIICIATGLKRPSNNRKTGPMLQTWILRADVEPHIAQQTLDDASVCGDCPLRPGTGGYCYVRTGDAPLSVYRAYHRGAYHSAESWSDRADLAARYRIRAGSYGDPVAVPLAIWATLSPETGYTHQWKREEFQAYRHLLMASVDSVDEQKQAKSMGWRTFRAKRGDDPYLPGEIECLADARGRSCYDCRLCDGWRDHAPQAPDIALEIHGALKSRSLAVLA